MHKKEGKCEKGREREREKEEWREEGEKEKWKVRERRVRKTNKINYKVRHSLKKALT